MNKSKKNKLTIKSNWDKNLTISDNDMNVLKGGATTKQACTTCGAAGTFQSGNRDCE